MQFFMQLIKYNQYIIKYFNFANPLKALIIKNNTIIIKYKSNKKRDTKISHIGWAG